MDCRSKEQIFCSVNVFCNHMNAVWIGFPLPFIVGIKRSQLRLMQFASFISVLIILAYIHITGMSNNIMTECACGMGCDKE